MLAAAALVCVSSVRSSSQAASLVLAIGDPATDGEQYAVTRLQALLRRILASLPPAAVLLARLHEVQPRVEQRRPRRREP